MEFHICANHGPIAGPAPTSGRCSGCGGQVISGAKAEYASALDWWDRQEDAAVSAKLFKRFAPDEPNPLKPCWSRCHSAASLIGPRPYAPPQ
jgi:hypothetical protein